MHLAEIDEISNNGNSLLHRTGTIAKVILVMCILASFIITNDLMKLGFLIGVLLILFIIGKVPLNKVIHLGLYPAFFSIIFALLRAQQGWLLGIIVIVKAVGTAFTMILLITTTSYVDIFSFFSLFMPSLLVDIFLFTYRSFFILISKIENLFKNMRLRGGYRSFNIFKNLKNIAAILGMLIIHSFEMSERMYKIYSLRGYQGTIPLRVELWPLKGKDFIFITLGLMILTGTVMTWSL
ncbi:cobalt transport protein [Alkaliphilus metalliredigens QYMF]|uniref:Cobalt transport protein n=1 Tax=Alkaliphilus metalliredigens (strain QYMF) TaxID=293826 RepID=A6TNR1_ALKMQ|nr:energy-coupling factor transporter transmembrane component T [Alkaliphilus metalliredigens]ABR47829.1 cobalt transport protein [Alkaliphilus metalliredigens QYMF]